MAAGRIWTPSLWGAGSEVEPGVIEREVFQMLDKNKDGYLSLEAMRPLLNNPQRELAVMAQMRRCKNPEVGLSPREFAAAFRKDMQIVQQVYTEKFEEEFSRAKSPGRGPQSKKVPKSSASTPQLKEPLPGRTPRKEKTAVRTPRKAQTLPFEEDVFVHQTKGKIMPFEDARTKAQILPFEEEVAWQALPVRAPRKAQTPRAGAQAPERSAAALTGRNGPRTPRAVVLDAAVVEEEQNAEQAAANWTLQRQLPNESESVGLTNADIRTARIRQALMRRRQDEMTVAKAVPEQAEGELAASRHDERQRRRTAPAGVALTPGGKRGKAAPEEPARRWRAKEPTPSASEAEAAEAAAARPDEQPAAPSRWHAKEPAASPNTTAAASDAQSPAPRRLSVHFDDAEHCSEAVSPVPDQENAPSEAEEQLRKALEEIERLKQQLAAAKESSVSGKEVSAAKEKRDSGRRQRSHSIGGPCQEASGSTCDEELEPLPPDSSCWDWPLSRHEKKARIQLLERQMNAMDRQSLIQELRRGSSDGCESDSDDACAV